MDGTTGTLDGKVALVTGASSGLGRRFAEVLSGEGARVVLAARRTDRLAELEGAIRSGGGEAASVAMDVLSEDSIEAAVAAAEAAFGPIDILVNNSGISVQKRIVETSAEDYDRVMGTNARGAFLVARAVARRMIEAKVEGRIVNIASVAAEKAIRELSVYCMSKAALLHLTRVQALEWARYGINVNAICPGYLRTEINDAYWDTEPGRKFVSTFPRRRVGEPSDLDGALLLLCSPGARMLTGSAITVDDALSVA